VSSNVPGKVDVIPDELVAKINFKTKS